MKSRAFLASVLTGAIAACAGEQSLRATAVDIEKPEPVREHKSANLLMPLEARCKRMLQMQLAVHDGIRELGRTIAGHPDNQPRPRDKQAAARLSYQQEVIIGEATRAINMLSAEGAAVAFCEVFDQVRADMKSVRARLKRCDVGPKTQAIEQDILDALKEMTAALRCGPSQRAVGAQ